MRIQKIQFFRNIIQMGVISMIILSALTTLFSSFSVTPVVIAQENTNSQQSSAQTNTATSTSNTRIDNVLGKNFGCEIGETDLEIQNLFRPTEYLPVIPDNCATTPEGDPIPLSPTLIPLIAARLFGLIASLIFFLLTFVVIISGIMWTWSGIDGKSLTQAKTNFRDALTAVLVLISTYIIISTILGIITPDSINTDLNNIFINRT